MTLRRSLASLALALATAACGDDTSPAATTPPAPLPGDPSFVRDASLDVTLESTAGSARSHNVGESCMACHQAHGPGRGRFTVAGTLHDATGKPVSAGTVRLSVPGAAGPAKKVLAVDALGNFYTTEDVGLDAGVLTVTVEGADGLGRTAMPWPTLSGACNHCHTGSFGVRLAP
ncbi:MAG: hypothetical protein RL199_371 [Pseudomonadota bacterium]|jgi:hypothetical protein